MADDRGYMNALSGGTDAATPDMSANPAGAPNMAALNTLAGQPQGDAATPEVAPQPTTGPTDANGKPSLWRNILAGVVTGMTGGLGAKTIGASAAAGAGAEINREQNVKNNDLAQQQNTRANQEAADAHQAAQERSAYNQTQLQVLTHQLHLMDPSSPEYVAKFTNDQATATDEAVKAGARVLFTAASPSLVQQKLHDDHFNKGDFEPQLQAIHGSDGKVQYAAVVYPDATNSQPLNLTYAGADGKPVSKTFAPGTINMKSWNQVQISEASKDVDHQFELHKQAQQEAFQRQQTAATQNAETNRSLLGKAIDQGQASVNVGPGGKLTVTPNSAKVDSFGMPIGVTPEGQPLPQKEYTSRNDKFGKDYVQPLNVLQKTTMEFDRINNNPNQTGAEKVTALLNAVGISGDPLKGKGFRISNDIINEHAEARNIWESGVQKLNKIAGTGGPITSQQIKDYTNVAEGVVHDAYVTAAQEARRQGLPVNFLPKPISQNQKANDLTLRIYADSAGGNVEAAHKALTAAGWK